MSVLSTLRIPYIPTVICKCIHSVSYQISHSLRAGLIKNYGNMWTAFVASFQCVVGELGQTAPPCMPPNAGHFHARLHLLHAIKIPEKVTNFWQPLSLWYIPIFLGLPIFHFCIFHGFSILIEIYAHNPMRRGVGGGKGNAEVDAVLERVASSPLWSRVRQKVLQIVENVRNLHAEGKVGGARPQPDMIYRRHFCYLCLPPLP